MMVTTYGYAYWPVRSVTTHRRGIHVCDIEDTAKGKWTVVVWDGSARPSLVPSRTLERQSNRFEGKSATWEPVVKK